MEPTNYITACTINERAFFQVMTNSNLLKEITKWQRGKKWDEITSGDWCALNGHLSLLKAKCDLKFTINAMDWAAQKGYLDIVNWLHENRTEGCTYRAMDYAAKNGHIHIVKYLHYTYHKYSVSPMSRAAERGRLDIVKFFHSVGSDCEWDTLDKVMYNVASSAKNSICCVGHDGWCKANDNIQCRTAHVKIANLFRENNFKCFTFESLNYAAEYGDLDFFKWILFTLKERYPDYYLADHLVNAIHAAIRMNHIELVKWLFANGVKRISYWHMIRESSHEEVTKWLLAQPDLEIYS
jgi:ankyrin repeat protein